jgi:hypothetical protein
VFVAIMSKTVPSVTHTTATYSVRYWSVKLKEFTLVPAFVFAKSYALGDGLDVVHEK